MLRRNGQAESDVDLVELLALAQPGELIKLDQSTAHSVTILMQAGRLARGEPDRGQQRPPSHGVGGGRFEWYSGFDQIELDSPRASLGQIRTERPEPAPVSPLSEAHAGGGIADPQPRGSVVAAHDLDALVPGVAHDVGLVDPPVLGFGDKPGPQRMRRIPRRVLQAG